MNRAGLLLLLRDLCRHLDRRHSLADLSRRTRWSPFHLQRAFRGLAGETPRQLIERLRLERAAGRLVGSGESILDIALAAGFTSHEVFTRAFRRQFGRYRSLHPAVPSQFETVTQEIRHARDLD